LDHENSDVGAREELLAEDDKTEEVLEPPLSDANAPAENRVMVKVTSMACHGMLVLPDYALLWNMSDLNLDVARGVLSLISRSLHASHVVKVKKIKRGLIQLMPDLQATGYCPLSPKMLVKEGFQRRLCKAFRLFILETLVPLALLGVVHGDIRPAYNLTYNVLYCNDQCAMRMIDLDSLIEFKNVGRIPRDKRIVSPENGRYSLDISSALEFVCLQVICIATVWRDGRKQENVSKAKGPTGNEEGEAEDYRDTEVIIRNYLINTIGDDVFETPENRSGGNARTRYFSKSREKACSFVLSEVQPLLDEFLTGQGR
jgi:hypothetical protein